MKLIDKRGKETQEKTEMVEVLPPPENAVEKLNRVKQEIENQIKAAREKLAYDDAVKQGKEIQAKAQQEEINFENQTFEVVLPMLNKLKEEAGDLVNNPEFILGLLATIFAYGLDSEKLINNKQWNYRLFRFIRAYKRKGGNETK